MQHNPTELFQTALGLAPGETIVIPCRDYKEVEALRATFYRELRKLRDMSKELAQEMCIKRICQRDQNCVVLAKRKAIIRKAVLIRADGSTEILEPTIPSDESSRIAELMRQDGKSEEDIENYLGEGEEEDD